MNLTGINEFRGMCAKIKDSLDALGTEEWRALLLENYRQFNFMSDDHKWIEALKSAPKNALIPEDFTSMDLKNLLDEMENALLENPYFVDLLNQIPWDKRGYSPIKPSSQETYLPHMISFAYCLNQINSLLRQEPDILDAVIKHYWAIRKKNHFYRWSNLLAMIKLHSIELPVVRFLRARKKGWMPASFGKYILTINIIEATIYDCVVGLYDNALSTLPLIFFSPNYRGMGFIKRFKKGQPSSFSADGKGLCLFSPNPKEWADLYQVWNMAFVTQFNQAPYLLIKLMIPSVAKYRESPSEYMHTRITALHLTLNYLDTALMVPKLSVDLKNLGPSEKGLTKLWGKVNRECSKKYWALLYQDKKKGA